MHLNDFCYQVVTVLLCTLALAVRNSLCSPKTDKELVDGMLSGNRPFYVSSTEGGKLIILVYPAAFKPAELDIDQFYVFEADGKSLKSGSKIHLKNAIKLKNKWPTQAKYLEEMDKTDLQEHVSIIVNDETNSYMMHLRTTTQWYDVTFFNLAEKDTTAVAQPKKDTRENESINYSNCSRIFSSVEKQPCWYCLSGALCKRFCIVTSNEIYAKNIADGVAVKKITGKNLWICKQEEGAFNVQHPQCSDLSGPYLSAKTGYFDAEGKAILFSPSSAFMTTGSVRQENSNELLHSSELSELFVVSETNGGTNVTSSKVTVKSFKTLIIFFVGVTTVLVIAGLVLCFLSTKKTEKQDSKVLAELKDKKGNLKNTNTTSVYSHNSSSGVKLNSRVPKNAVKNRVSSAGAATKTSFSVASGQTCTTMRSKALSIKMKT